MTRSRTALRFLLRSLDLRAASFVLAVGAVTVGASVTATSLTLRADLGAKMTRELRAYGPNLLVAPPMAGASGGSAPTLEGGRVERLGELAPAGLAMVVSPLLLAGGTVEGRPATLVGADFAAVRALGASWKVNGAWPERGEEIACLIGSALARRVGAEPGVWLTAGPHGGTERAFRVAGVLSTGESEEDQILLPLCWLQEATGLPGRVSLAAVSLDGGPEEVAELARRIEAAGAGDVEARPLPQVSEAQGALLGKLDAMMILLTAVVLALAGLCVMTTLMSMVVEREPEIGLMRSLGASDGEVRWMLLGEATLVGALGSLLGLGLGMLNASWIGRQIFGTWAAVRPGIIPGVLAITLALCWLAVVLPLRRALAVQPAAALRTD